MEIGPKLLFYLYQIKINETKKVFGFKISNAFVRNKRKKGLDEEKKNKRERKKVTDWFANPQDKAV